MSEYTQSVNIPEEEMRELREMVHEEHRGLDIVPSHLCQKPTCLFITGALVGAD